MRIGSALLFVAAVPAFAHHSFAVFFDADKSVTVRGVVQEFQFRNPHGLLKVLVKNENGEEAWKAETNSPSILERRGWTRESIKVGEIISIEGWPARDGSHYMRVRVVKRADGTPVGTAVNPAETVGEQK